MTWPDARAPGPGRTGAGREDRNRRGPDDRAQPTKFCGHAQAIRDARFRRDVDRLHNLGPRAVAELLREIGRDTSRMAEVEQRVAAYARLDPEIVRAVGADRWPPHIWRAT